MDKAKESIKTDSVKEIYQNLFKEHGRTEKALCWSKNKQDVRFKSLTEEIARRDLNSFTVLDFGCGLGDLYSYLINIYGDKMDYTGVDITSDFIQSNKETFEGASFEHITNVYDVENEYDFIILSGVFNLLYTKEKDIHQNIVFEIIQQLFNKTKIAISLDFMTDDVDFEQDGAFHQNPFTLQKWLKENITKRMRLDFSYMPYEFSITILKNKQIVKGRNIYE